MYERVTMRARVSAFIRVSLATITALTAAARAHTPAPAAGPPTARHLSAPADGIGFGVVPQLGGLTSLTIAVRLKVDPDDFAGGVRSIVSVWGPGAGANDLTFALRQANGKFVIYFQRSGGFYGINTVDGPLLRDGRPDPGWNTYFFRWAAGQKNLGVFKGDPACFTSWATDADISGLTSLPSPATGELWVGREPASGAAFPPIHGAVADLAFFGGALSEDDMRWIAAGAAPSSATSAPLLFWAPLAGGGATESTAATSDGVTRTGSVNGTVTVPAPFTAPLTVHANLVVAPAALAASAGLPATIAVRWGVLGPAASPVMLTPSAAQGTFDPPSATLGTDPDAAVTFAYTPGYSAGPDTIAVTPGGGLPAISVPVTIAPPPARIAGARVLPHGQSLLIDLAGPGGSPARLAARDDHTPAVATNPAISVNGGAPIALIGPLTPVSQPLPYTPYYMSWATFLLPSTPPSLARLAAQDPTSFQSSGGWQPGLPGFKGKGLLANAAGAGGNDLDATATYTLSGLEAGGTYDLHATWVGYSPLCPRATYTAHDGPASGPVLGTFAVDQTRVPSDQKAPSSLPAGVPPWIAEENLDWAYLGRVTPTGTTVTVVLSNGNRAGVLAADGLRVERVRQFTTIGPDDVVTLSAPQRWATTEAGDVAGVTDLAVANLVGGALSPVTPNTKTMKVGWNPEAPLAFASSASFYNNRYHSVYNYTLGAGSFSGRHAATTDDRQNLTGLTYDDGPPVRCSPLYLTVSQNSGDGVGPRNLASCPPDGVWTLRWRGKPGILSLVGSGTGDVAEALGEAVDPATGENVARFRLAAGPGATAPTVSLRFYHPTDPTAVPEKGSIKIFDPLADPAEKTLFSPYFLDLIAGAGCIRHLETFCYANPDAAEFAHLSDDTAARLGVNFPLKTLGGDVIRVSPVDISPANKDRATWYFPGTRAVKLVFAAPHGLSDGQGLTCSILDPATGGTRVFPSASGGDISIPGGFAIVLDPTTVMVTCGGTTGTDRAVPTDTVTRDFEPPSPGAWRATCNVGTGPSLDTIIELGRVTGAIQWLSLPHPVTDDCCTKIGEYLVAHTPPGRKFAIEFSNEVWNANGGLFYCYAKSLYYTAAATAGEDLPGMGNNARNWYTYRAGQVHKLIRAPFEAAGRGDDLIRVMGSQTGYASGVTFPTVDVAEQFKIPIDWLAIDGYLDNESAGGRYDPGGMPAVAGPLIDAMNVEQLIDLFAVHVRRDNSTRYIDQHRQLLDRHGFSGTKLVVYEGGIGNAVPSPRTYNRVPTAQALLRHPGLHQVLLDWFRVQQDAGISLFNWFILNGGPFVPQGAGWAAYPSYGMRPGRGDGSDGRFDNRANFQDLARIVSVEGAAVRDWAASVKGPPVTPPVVTAPEVTPNATLDLPPGEYGLDVINVDGKMRLRVRAKEAAPAGK